MRPPYSVLARRMGPGERERLGGRARKKPEPKMPQKLKGRPALAGAYTVCASTRSTAARGGAP